MANIVPLIQLDNIEKVFLTDEVETHALAGENLEIQPGEYVASSGPSAGGQQQRVAVARALGGRPSILLADEPTGNLDSKNGQAVMDLLGELHAEGATICLVTHDERYARDAQRAIHLFDGQIVSEPLTA